MKVAYILHDTDPFGGANRSFLQMLYAVMQKGIVPLVVLPDSNGIYCVLQEKGIKTLVLNYRPNTYPYENSIKDFLLWVPRLLARQLVNAIAARQLAKQIEGFDIVHTNVSIIDIGAVAASQIGIPHIYHFREYADLDFNMRYFPCKKRFYKTVTHAICITKGIQAHHHLSEKSEVIYNILNSNKPAYETTDTEKKYILYAGRLEPTKGIEDLLAAYAKSKRILPLWIAGTPLTVSYLDQLKQQTQQYGIADKVQFLGARTDVTELMAGACATIIPSHNEGFGRVLPEAMLAKCLTIGRNTGGTKEQLDNGLKLTGSEIGLRFNTKDELTNQIDKVCMTDRTEWSSCIECAYKTVNTLYTQEACVNAIMNFYHNVTQAK